ARNRWAAAPQSSPRSSRASSRSGPGSLAPPRFRPSSAMSGGTMERPMYHDHSRVLQDRFDSRRIADRLAEKLLRSEFSDEDCAFIARQSLFFLATADAQGRPDCSYK